MKNIDKKWMLLALSEAKKAWGKTSPNPLVGAVIVAEDDKLLGKGYHHQAGKAHAEVEAIAACEKSCQGSTIYVTLEPCSTFGRTPPCTKAIIDAGIKRVVIGCLDPNPNHAGKAVDILRTSQIEVIVGVEEEQCLTLNESFFYWIQHKKPFVTLKMAITLDGKIATKSGQSQWITGKEAREEVQRMRQACDAIMVGGETVRLDDPSLTVRTPQNWDNQPQKIVWTRQPSANFANELQIFADSAKPPRFHAPNDSSQWQELLQQFGKENCLSLLLEGGGELAANALQSGIVNKLVIFIAPKILGGRDSRSVVAGDNPQSLAEALQLENLITTKIGNDIMITAYPINL